MRLSEDRTTRHAWRALHSHLKEVSQDAAVPLAASDKMRASRRPPTRLPILSNSEFWQKTGSA